MKRRMTYAVLALVILATFLVPLPVAAQSALDGTSWILSSLDGQIPLPDTTITLQFDEEGTASGSDGCNRYSLPATIEGTSITFGENGALGMMACPEVVMDQAATYMTALASSTRFVVRGGNLVLLDGVDILATFVAVLDGLDGTLWQVRAYNDGRSAVTSVLEGTEITAEFDNDNRVTGSAGCNDYFGTFLTTEGSIFVGRLGVTRRLCSQPSGVMEQEAAYLAALESATIYTIEGNDLTLRDSSDAIAVMLVRVLGVTLPEPEPGVPTGRVTAPHGVNVRTGPGTNFPTLGVAPYGTEGEIIGRSADGAWWVVAVPTAPGGSAWVSADFVAASDADDVPIIAAPPPPVIIPPPTPLPTPTPVPAATPTPSPQISFTADRTTINQGECTTLRWSVENVQAVWVYPQGQPYQNYPRVGQGSEQVCPPTTTTYEMRVLQRNGAVVFRQVTVNVVPAAPTNPLNGTAWQVTSYNNGQNAVVTPISGTNLTTRFDASQLSGNSGCNQYSGPYSVSGTSIWIGDMAAGMMMCSDVPGIMEQETAFLAALRSAATFRFDGNRLELRGWDGSIAVIFSRLQ